MSEVVAVGCFSWQTPLWIYQRFDKGRPYGALTETLCRGCCGGLLGDFSGQVQGLPGASFWRYVLLRGAPCRPYAGLRRAPRRLHVALFGLVFVCVFVLAPRRRGSAGCNFLPCFIIDPPCENLRHRKSWRLILRALLQHQSWRRRPSKSSRRSPRLRPTRRSTSWWQTCSRWHRQRPWTLLGCLSWGPSMRSKRSRWLLQLVTPWPRFAPTPPPCRMASSTRSSNTGGHGSPRPSCGRLDSSGRGPTVWRWPRAISTSCATCSQGPVARRTSTRFSSTSIRTLLVPGRERRNM